MNNAKEEGTLKYFIAAAVVGACIGNMFVARRMRSIMKMKVPTGENVTGASSASRSTGERVDANRARRFAEESARERLRQEQRIKDYNYQSEQQEQVKAAYQSWMRNKYNAHNRPKFGGDFLSIMTPSLSVLGLPTSQLPSRKEIKDAYARIAMHSHPDKVPEDNPRRAQLQRQFTEASGAYKLLLQHVDALESSSPSSK